MSSTMVVKHVLRFAEGRFLITGSADTRFGDNSEGLYFLPHGHDTAYQCYGESKSLHGKFGRTMDSTNPDVKKYHVTYEFEDGALLAARLIGRNTRSKGVLADAREQADIADRLADGRIKTRVQRDAPTIYGACWMADGRMLLHVYNLPGKQGYSLLTGQPGAYKELDVAFAVQGGNSHRYTLKDGSDVELNWQQDRTGRTAWTFAGQPMQPLPLTHTDKDIATYGLTMASTGPHLDPFSPELQAPSAPRARAPKGP